MIAITGATGQLGRLVIESLLKKMPASEIVAAVRSPDKAADFAKLGVQVREADYSRPATFDAAFKGVHKLLLISSSEVGQRATQHQAVIDAAKRTGAQLIAYTSILRADTSPLGLATEHRETEAALKASGVPYVLLRNGWYTENYTMSAPTAVQHGAVLGSAKDGRISSAARADYADAAAAVLTATESQAGRVYELAGDSSYTLTDLAAAIAKESGKPVVYKDLPEADYSGVLVSVGLPKWLSDMLAESDVGASKGGLFDDGRALSKLTGRPTTPLSVVVADALKA